MTPSDPALLAAIGNGDRAALEQVYRTYKDDLLTAAVHLLGERGLAEDVLHDVFVTLAAKASQIELRGSLKGYLVTSCLNRARDTLRSRTRQPVKQALAADRADGAPRPADAVQCEERRQQVAGAVAALPAEQREVVVLHVHGEMTFRDVAQRLDIPQNTAQSRYRYALASLRRLLEREEVD